MTPRGKQAQQNERTILHANHPADIPPGRAYTVDLNLADYYDLQPGKFIVHLQLLSQNSDMYPEGTDRLEATAELRKPEKEFTRPSASVPIVVTEEGTGGDGSR